MKSMKNWDTLHTGGVERARTREKVKFCDLQIGNLFSIPDDVVDYPFRLRQLQKTGVDEAVILHTDSTVITVGPDQLVWRD